MGFYLGQELKIEIIATKNSAKSILKTIVNFKKRKNAVYRTEYYSLF